MRKIFLIAVLFLGVHSVSFADEVWEDVTHGIPENDFRAVAVYPKDGNGIYVGSSKSLYRSVDGGGTWRKILSLHGTLKEVHQIQITPQEIWVASDSGLYDSFDKGETWEKSFGALGGKGERVLSIALGKEGIMWAGTGGGLFQSEDRGRNWSRVPGALSNQEIIFIATDRGGKVFAATPSGLYRSTDLAENWERIFVTSVAEKKGEGSDEGGEEDTEESETDSSRVLSIWIRNGNPEEIILGTRKGVFHSTDDGKQWTRVGEEREMTVNALFEQGGVLYAATEKGVFAFKDKWEDLSQGLTQGQVNALTGMSHPLTLWAAGRGGIFRRKEEVSFAGLKENDADKVLHYFDQEPSIQEIQEAAIRYAEVHPEKIALWRKAASRKAYLPTLSTGVDLDNNRNTAIDTGGTTQPDFFIVGPDDRNFNWDVNLSWDLGELIWNGDQTSIDVRSRLMVELRDDVLDEVTRLYFERRRLQITLLLEPPETVREKVEKTLRLSELTAGIDALTGNYLSRAIDRMT